MQKIRKVQRRMAPVLAALAVAACGGGGGSPPSPPPAPQPPAGSTILPDPTPAPGATQVQMPFLNRPFAGDHPLGNYMDHDRPEGPRVASGGYQLTWRGQHAIPCRDAAGRTPCVGYDSHTGYDWALPENTPVLAMADGEVFQAGPTAPAPCVLMNEEVTSALLVAIGHRAPNGEIYTVGYLHLNRIDVAVGDRVTAGQQIGLSGVTGCVGYKNGVKWAHLHLEFGRVANTNDGDVSFTDPYGWNGPGEDPYKTNPNGSENIWLWNPGQAPSLVP
jgi:murein DD-endopeptidase MepM/ murein hydrolase activator NlpD